MAESIRVAALARELGLTNMETLDLCDALGIGAKSHTSSIVEAQADRVRRKAEREGLIRKAQPSDKGGRAKPSKGRPTPRVKASPAPPAPDLTEAADEAEVPSVAVRLACRLACREFDIPEPVLAHEFDDPTSGEVLAEADAFWSVNSLFPGSEPVALLEDNDEEMVLRLQQLDVHLIVGVQELKGALEEMLSSRSS